jgi:integrase
MQQLKTPTLQQVYLSYLDVKRLKPKSVKVYNQIMSTSLATFQSLPVTQISPHMVLQLHKKLPPYAGNIAMRLLRALFNFAELPPPTVTLTRNRVWNKERRRKTVLTPGSNGTIRQFCKGATALQDSELRDFLLFLLFTGLRKSEVLNLEWSDVNLKTSVVTLRTTKRDENVVLPLNTYALSILALKTPSSDGKVFRTSASTQQLARVGVDFCLHDLRRTYITAGDDCDIRAEVTKQLVNHALSGVTDGYICRSTEKLRVASQTIGDYLRAQTQID